MASGPTTTGRTWQLRSPGTRTVRWSCSPRCRRRRRVAHSSARSELTPDELAGRPIPDIPFVGERVDQEEAAAGFLLVGGQGRGRGGVGVRGGGEVGVAVAA